MLLLRRRYEDLLSRWYRRKPRRRGCVGYGIELGDRSAGATKGETCAGVLLLLLVWDLLLLVWNLLLLVWNLLLLVWDLLLLIWYRRWWRRKPSAAWT